jgi:hypothetical protein
MELILLSNLGKKKLNIFIQSFFCGVGKSHGRGKKLHRITNKEFIPR